MIRGENNDEHRNVKLTMVIIIRLWYGVLPLLLKKSMQNLHILIVTVVTYEINATKLHILIATVVTYEVNAINLHILFASVVANKIKAIN